MCLMEATFNVGWLELLIPPDEAGVVLLELLEFEAEAELVVPLI